LTVILFPPHAERTKGIVRLSTADSLPEVYRQPHPAIRIVPDDGAQEPPDASRDREGFDRRSDDDQDSGGDVAASGTLFQNALPER
jgi:hypothetical protein